MSEQPRSEFLPFFLSLFLPFFFLFLPVIPGGHDGTSPETASPRRKRMRTLAREAMRVIRDVLYGIDMGHRIMHGAALTPDRQDEKSSR
jgi:hypothetical protein